MRGNETEQVETCADYTGRGRILRANAASPTSGYPPANEMLAVVVGT